MADDIQVVSGATPQQNAQRSEQSYVGEDGRRVVVLKHPLSITLKGADGSQRVEQTRELRLRRVTGADVRIIANMGNKHGDITATLVDRLAGEAVFDRLDAEDIVAISEVIQDFLPSGLKIGG